MSTETSRREGTRGTDGTLFPPLRLPAILVAAPGIAVRRLQRSAAHRNARPHLAMLGLPVGIIAASLTQPLCVVPLLVCAWWWTPRRWGWEWTTVAGRGLIGTEWALIGVNALAAFSNQTLFVGACWLLAAVALGLASHVVRLRG